MEIWKSIEGYDNKYYVSNYGRIKSFKQKKEGKILKQFLTSKDKNRIYYHIWLSINNKHKMYLVSRLVAQAFISNPGNKPHVNHIDGNKLNNHYMNLEWCTPKENTQHAYNTRLHKRLKGEINPNVKLTEKNVKEILQLRFEKKWTYKKIAEKYNVTSENIGYICRKETWTHISKRVLEK